MIRGWFMEIPSWRGRVGIRIPESGLTVRISRLASASESAGTAVSDGVGITGDSIGITGTQSTATAGTIPAATRFITGPILGGVDSGAADSTTAAMAETGSAAETAADSRTAPDRPPGLSTETGKLPEDTLNLEVRAVCARAPSAATTMAAKPGAFPHAEVPVSAARTAVADLTEADVVNRAFIVFLSV
jgi:hypothetical protein